MICNVMGRVAYAASPPMGGAYPGEFDVLGTSATPEPAQLIRLAVLMIGLTWAVWRKRRAAAKL